MLDIDADGDGDLICGEYQGHLQFYRNVGTPDSFVFYLEDDNWFSISVGNGDDADPTFCDIDDDGDMDLFIGEEEGNIWHYENIGTPDSCNFIYITDYFDSIDVGSISSPEFADIDGDGDYDLFIGSGASGPSFYENIGTPEIHHFRLKTSDYLTMDLGYPVDEPQVVDINGDGALDLIIDLPSTLAYFENRGSSQNPDFLHITDTFQGISLTSICPYFVDIDADTDYDLFCGQADIPGPPGLYLFSNQGTPQNALFILYSNNLVPGNFFVIIAPSLADIDADDDYDLFISDQWNGDYFFYENIGTPSQPDFIYRTTNWQGISTGVQTQSCFYDIDQDGDLDLFMIPWNDWNQVWFYKNVGTVQNAQMILETQTFLSLEALNIFFGINIIDIDQDGDGDFFLSTDNGGCMFFRNVTGEPPAVRPKVVSPYRGPVLTLGPNPANPVTWVTFHLPVPQKATLAVYNLLGRKVATLTQGLQPAGANTYLWNASHFASGVYIIRLEMGKEEKVGKVVVVR